MTSPIGLARPRPDAPAKARGATRYAADRRIHGLLHARLVLATHAHARVVAIDSDAALATPGVVAVLRAADLPITARGRDRLSVPLARSEVVFAGQPVALVVAETEAAAEDGAELVDVRLEPLPVVLDPEEAMRPDAPLAWREIAEEGDRTGSMDAQTHAGVGGTSDESIESEELSANVAGRSRYWDGDVAAALAGAAVVREGRFTTSWIHQGYLEPQACTAWVDPDGTLVVESATQALFGSRNEVAKALGLDQRQVRVVGTTLGGAFGGKWPLFDTLIAAAALRLRRPVRLVVTRAEDFAATNPGQSFVTELRIGADRDGTFTGLECRMIADTGAFDEGTSESLGGVLVAGPYAWPAFDVRAYGVRTNRFGVGAYRGPSAPPSAMALETLIDELAGELGIDPIELRRRNLATEGAPMVDGESWPMTGGAEVLEAMAASPVWQGRSRQHDGEGVGLALGYWPGATNAAAAACRMSPDGSVQVLTGIVDMSGVTGGFQAIVAETLGMDPDLVQLVFLDSSSAPTSPGSGGSQITYAAGRAIRKAAEATARLLLEAAAVELEISIDDLELVDGTVRPRGTPERAIPISKLVRANARAGRPPIEAHGVTDNPGIAPSVAGHVARVRVDRDTGNIEVLEDHVVQDVGRVLNPALVAGQQHGGAAQAIGWATLEELRHDENGQLQTGTFLDYAMPRARDVGQLRTTSVEVPAPQGPLGAKGIGEAPVIAGPAAIANAVAAATGLRLRDLPMSRTRVWAALNDA
ncbi:MAG TPA: xanthine dehydrogenase family protein molybdopterin-binding subunit [Patescibacteria group bacterium]|jgi:CO/xanthine dehydrogenase Mo-binding subunit|nr:xanthine dehydrogenase family protein molybdopterin-binding subunit [Patescibacteria group bacterium]